jgi:hypothetical protein
MIRVIIITILLSLSAFQALAANYTLEIIQPQPSLSTANRYYKTYTGLEYKVPVGVFGGTFPFSYALTVNPSGMVIDSETGIITWSNPIESGSPHSITVQVTDADENTDSVSWTLTVNTSNAVFVDAVDGENSSYNGCSASCGTGTFANPFKELGDVYTGGVTAIDGDFTTAPILADSTYSGYIMYLMAGTYAPQGYATIKAHGYEIDWQDEKPQIFIAADSETVVIDHDDAAASASGGIFKMDASTNIYIQGIDFRDGDNNIFQIGGVSTYTTIFDNTFTNLTDPTDGQNAGFILFSGDGTPGFETFDFISRNTFTNPASNNNTSCVIRLYSTRKSVIEGNTMVETVGAAEHGIDLKEGTVYIDIRSNIFDSFGFAKQIGDSMNPAGNIEIRYNLFNDGSATINGGNYGPLSINKDSAVNGPFYVTRNTIDGVIYIIRCNTGSDGPYVFKNNVIVNEIGGVDDPDGSGIYQTNSTGCYLVEVGVDGESNLYGNAADGIIDSNGDLTEAYSGYLGTHGYQTIPPEEIPPQGENVRPIGTTNVMAIGTTSVLR